MSDLQINAYEKEPFSSKQINLLETVLGHQ